MVIKKGCEFMISLNGGYAMIKYNSTQEELQIAYRSKKPVLCYDENRRAHWAVIEETATESVDEETQEPITIYEYSYRLIDEASSGGKLYLHRITLPYNNGNNYASFEMLSQKDSAYTYAEIVSWLNSLGTGGGWQGGVCCSTTNANATVFPLGIAQNSNVYIAVFYWDGTKVARETLNNPGITIYDNYIEV